VKTTRILALALLPLLFGCSTAYYGAMERVGKEKRHILKSRVESTRKEQREAQEEFQSAYERFQSVTHYDGGNVETVYRDLADALDSSEARAHATTG